ISIVKQDGYVIDAKLDPKYGYVTQTEKGITLIPTDPGDVTQTIEDPTGTGQIVPAYLVNTAAVTIRYNGEDVTVRQPIVDGGAMMSAYWRTTGTPSGPATAASLRGSRYPIPGPATSVDPLISNGQRVMMPVRSVTTYENGKKVSWVSIDGKEWLRFTGEGQAPRVVVGAGVSYQDGKWMKNGEEIDPVATGDARWWGADGSSQSGAAWGFGAPGTFYESRNIDPKTNTFDGRPSWVIRTEVVDRARRLYGGMGGPTEAEDGPNAGRRPLNPQREGGEWDAAQAEKLAIRAARAASQPRFPGKEADDRLPFDLGRQREDIAFPWNTGEVRPRSQRPAPVLKPIQRGPLITEDPRDIGVMPKPSPTLRPAPTPELTSVETKRAYALKPVTAPKLPKKPKPTPKGTGGPKTAHKPGAAKKPPATVKPIVMHDATGTETYSGGR
ncbi:MAG TPA: hypothetical protein VIU37_13505, partial [Candidatus Limnocylindrales bacterium]